MRKLLQQTLSTLCKPAVWIPAALLAVATAAFWLTDLDLALVRPFFSGDATNPEFVARWPMTVAQPWKALYDWGIYPAWILGLGGLAVWIVSFLWKKIEPWRDPGLFYFLLLIVGPGILVNGVCKPYWSRPRPHAIEQFGGPRDFLPVLQLGFGKNDSSFPSGHASTGFYLMAPAFVLYRRRPWWAAAFLLLGLVCGGVIGAARVVAGGHFPSDILWSGGIVYFTALVLAAPFRFGKESP